MLFAIVLFMKNEKKTVPTGRIPRLSRKTSDIIRTHIDEEVIFERTREIMEQAPFSSTPRDRWGRSVGERHSNGFGSWLNGDIAYYTGRKR